MKEKWIKISEFNGKYEVSNMGHIRATKNNKQLSIVKHKNGYLAVGLSKDGKAVTRTIHRLVAEAFLENPDNLPQVNHKDENKENNCVDNLEWCSAKYNANYGTRYERYRLNNKRFRPVNQIDKESGKIIKKWDCISDASKALNLSPSMICKVCKDEKKTAGGYIWQYEG